MKTVHIRIPQIYWEGVEFEAPNNFDDLSQDEKTDILINKLNPLEYDNLVGGEKGLRSAIEEGYSKFKVLTD